MRLPHWLAIDTMLTEPVLLSQASSALFTSSLSAKMTQPVRTNGQSSHYQVQTILISYRDIRRHWYMELCGDFHGGHICVSTDNKTSSHADPPQESPLRFYQWQQGWSLWYSVRNPFPFPNHFARKRSRGEFLRDRLDWIHAAARIHYTRIIKTSPGF